MSGAAAVVRRRERARRRRAVTSHRAVVMFADVIGSFVPTVRENGLDGPSEDPEKLKESHDDKGKEYFD